MSKEKRNISVIKDAEGNKMYLYDVLNIKKKRASLVRHKPYPVKTHFFNENILLTNSFVNK